MALPPRLRTPAALLAVVLALATGCGQLGDAEARPGGAADERRLPAEAPPAPSTAAPRPSSPASATTAGPSGIEPAIDLGREGRYVALGDSFSAGDGLAPYDDRACGRSSRAFPYLAPFAGEVQREVLACEAAQVAAVSAQAEAAGLDADVGLVTVTVGGNDVGFIEFFTTCIMQAGCFDAPYGGQPSLRSWSQARFDALRPQLVALLSGLGADAPNARVALLGYPQLLPATLSSGPGCALLGAALDPGELAGLRAATDALNALLAETAQASGATFVPVADRFAGHEACGPGEPWLLFGGMAQLLTAPEGLLHPNDAGQTAYATALAEALRG